MRTYDPTRKHQYKYQAIRPLPYREHLALVIVEMAALVSVTGTFIWVLTSR